ncbi:MAG: hypothetical protein GYA14_02060, partial [Ignavibacteria bacterium]|nr:hypothetical protein [Ignavibacteria bacterium]
HPKKSHDDFSELPERTQSIIKKLSAILRVADSLDRTHKKIVKNVECRVTRNAIELSIEIKKNGNTEIELWSLDRRKFLFEEIFGRNLSVVVRNA